MSDAKQGGLYAIREGDSFPFSEASTISSELYRPLLQSASSRNQHGDFEALNDEQHEVAGYFAKMPTAAAAKELMSALRPHAQIPGDQVTAEQRASGEQSALKQLHATHGVTGTNDLLRDARIGIKHLEKLPGFKRMVHHQGGVTNPQFLESVASLSRRGYLK